MSEQIHVVTSADDNFVLPLAAALRSLALAHVEDPVLVHVMTDSIDTIDRQSLSKLVDTEWIDVPAGIATGVRLPSYLGESSAWRLFLADLLPSELNRVIYLDADVLVRRSLRAMWELDLLGNVVGAVRDPIIPWFGAPLGPPWEKLGVAAGAPYFNTGVMLIDLNQWRAANVGRSALDLLHEVQLPHGDQCALNTTLTGSLLRLPPTWNVQAGHLQERKPMAWIVEPAHELAEAMADPNVVHFNTSSFGRPWFSGCTHPFASAWLDALHSAPAWSDAKPRPAPRRPWKVRLRRAASTLLRG
jgi:lipopolysaccharide biosynthesis glycosyltransferase